MKASTLSSTPLVNKLSQHTYVNVMESLVAEEVGRQLQDVPTRIRRYLRMADVVTYALNRLPVLYASSESGWQYQRQIARREHYPKIKQVVRQAIIAVQVDPLRRAKALELPAQQQSEAVLQALRSLFNSPELTWEAALPRVRNLKYDTALFPKSRSHRHQAWQARDSKLPVVWPEGAYQERRHKSTVKPDGTVHVMNNLGWDNTLYCR